MKLIARLFAPAADADCAARAGQRLLESLAAFRPVQAEPPQRYWKRPEWYEHTLHLAPATTAAFDAVVALAGDGWHHAWQDAERSSVWNAAPGTTFVLPEVTWAEVLLVRTDGGP